MKSRKLNSNRLSLVLVTVIGTIWGPYLLGLFIRDYLRLFTRLEAPHQTWMIGVLGILVIILIGFGIYGVIELARWVYPEKE